MFFEKRGVSNSLSCKEIKDKLDVFVTESSISRWRKSERSQKLGVARGVSPCTAFESEVTKMLIFSCSSFDKDGKAVSSVLLKITYTYEVIRKAAADVFDGLDPETKTRNDSVCGVLAVPRSIRLREGGGYIELATCTCLPVCPLYRCVHLCW